jgi:hypothetical protein
MQRLQQQAASTSKEADAARSQAVLTQQQLASLQEERAKMAAAEAAQIRELEAMRAKEKMRDTDRSLLDEELRQLRQARDEADRKAAQQASGGGAGVFAGMTPHAGRRSSLVGARERRKRAGFA